jgi:hypothetical protein
LIDTRRSIDSHRQANIKLLVAMCTASKTFCLFLKFTKSTQMYSFFFIYNKKKRTTTSTGKETQININENSSETKAEDKFDELITQKNKYKYFFY